MPELDSEAIDFRAASEFFAPVRKLVKQDLLTLDVLVRHQGRLVPTVGGLLLFGKERASGSHLHLTCLATQRPGDTSRECRAGLVMHSSIEI